MTTDTVNAETKVYEVGYLLLPSISEEQLPAHVSEIKKLIDDAGGELISEEYPRFRPIAYEMTKLIGTRNERFNSAYFGWIKFEMSVENILILKSKLDATEAILRHLITKTVRESTYTSRIVETKDEESDDSIQEEVPTDAAIDEELDKSIDALIEE